MKRPPARRTRRMPKRNITSIITALALVSSTFVIATAVPALAACDYRDASVNDGWGWDAETRTSCAPQQTPAPSNNCDYSSANVNNGWGWDPVTRQSCPPLSTTPTTAAAPAPDVQVNPQVVEPVRPEVAEITVLAERTDASGRLAVISRTDDDGFRIVETDAEGETIVIQVEPGSTVWNLTSWHFEDRSALNTGLPETLDDAIRDNGWRRLSAEQSVFHQDPNVFGSEIKFVHEDGREAVYYVDGSIVTDPEYAGTFNYVNARPEPEGLLDIQGIIAWAFFGAGHLIADVVPFVIAQDHGGNGNSRGDNTTLGTTSQPDDSNLDLRDDDDDGIPAGQDQDDKDPNRGARHGTPLADDDDDGIINFNDEFPDDPDRSTSNPCAGSMSAAAGCGGNSNNNNNGGGGDGSDNDGGGTGGGSVQTSNGGSVQTSTGGTVQTGS